MKQIVFLMASGLLSTTVYGQMEGLGQALLTHDKAVPADPSLTGTWLFEVRRGGQPATQPPVLLFIQFNPAGTITAAAADANQSGHHGMWRRAAGRRFVFTTFLFSFNESRALANIIKVRGNVRLSDGGQTAAGTQEVVLMDRDGRVLATIPGGTFTGTRLTVETPADFDEFQNLR